MDLRSLTYQKSITPKKSMLIKLWKIKEKILEKARKKWHLTLRKKKSNDSGFLIWKHEEKEEVDQYFSGTKRKSSDINVIPRKTIL